MKTLFKMILLLAVFLITACSNDSEVDQNTGDPDQTSVDADNDGVINNEDLCPDTPSGEQPDETGCAPSQLDTDADGFTDDIDQCPDSPSDEDVDQEGCAPSQKDSDGDGITDDIDECPETEIGEPVDETGCILTENRTYVPDDGFEQTLINSGLDDVMDNYVLTSNIEDVTSLDLLVPDTNAVPPNITEIKDLTGLEDFKNLESLRLYYCKLNDFNIEELQQLNTLVLVGTTVNNGYSIENMGNLEHIFLEKGSNTPASLANNQRLTYFTVYSSSIESLSITENPNIKVVRLNDIVANSIIINNNIQLNNVFIGNENEPSSITSMEITNNPLMFQFSIAGKIDEIMFSDCEGLEFFTAIGEPKFGPVADVSFDSIDLGEFPKLRDIRLLSIELSRLDLSKNNLLTYVELEDLAIDCIQVNSDQLTQTDQWIVNFPVSFELDCSD